MTIEIIESKFFGLRKEIKPAPIGTTIINQNMFGQTMDLPLSPVELRICADSFLKRHEATGVTLT